MAGLFNSLKNGEKEIDVALKNMLLDDISEGLIVVNDEGNVIYSNALGQRMLEEGQIGPIDIISNSAKTFEFNHRIFEARYTKLEEKTGISGNMVTLIDTVGNTEKASEIEDLKNELERVRNFKANFLANMSHEIRTPIHAIIGFAEIIAKENLSDNVKEQMSLIKDSSYSLLAIINDVLDLSKLESGKLELVNSNYFISYVIRDIDATFSMLAIKKGITFEMHLDEKIPSNIHGDKIRLRGALLALLNNAIKFTKEGRVDFYINVLEKRQGTVKLEFVIKDTGVGIKKEDMGRIFESFSKFDMDSNNAVEGRGLGLSLAKGYVELMGGTIEAKSEFGVGSTFTITVEQKIVDDSPVDMTIVNSRKRKAERFKIHDYKVLVVDDNPINLSVAGGLMNSFGINVEKACGGREAIDACMTMNYDMIFMDQMMPDVDGIMALKEIRKISDYYADECKIIVLTADAMAGVRDRLMGEGFDEYLCKPLEIFRLENILRQFVPENNISSKEEDTINTTIEETKAIVEEEAKEGNELDDLSSKINIPKDILEKKVKDCGGDVDIYLGLCRKAHEAFDNKMRKLTESFAVKDYERLVTEIRSLRTSMNSLGAIDIVKLAKSLEDAGLQGEFTYICENVDNLLKAYEIFIKNMRVNVLGLKDAVVPLSGDAPEWSPEEISKVSKKLISFVEEYDFAAIFDLLEKTLKNPMGPKTREFFNKLEDSMNNMDIDSVNKQLGEFT